MPLREVRGWNRTRHPLQAPVPDQPASRHKPERPPRVEPDGPVMGNLDPGKKAPVDEDAFSAAVMPEDEDDSDSIFGLSPQKNAMKSPSPSPQRPGEGARGQRPPGPGRKVRRKPSGS